MIQNDEIFLKSPLIFVPSRQDHSVALFGEGDKNDDKLT